MYIVSHCGDMCVDIEISFQMASRNFEKNRLEFNPPVYEITYGTCMYVYPRFCQVQTIFESLAFISFSDLDHTADVQ